MCPGHGYQPIPLFGLTLNGVCSIMCEMGRKGAQKSIDSVRRKPSPSIRFRFALFFRRHHVRFALTLKLSPVRLPWPASLLKVTEGLKGRCVRFLPEHCPSGEHPARELQKLKRPSKQASTSLQEISVANQSPVGNNNNHPQSMLVLVPQSGNLYRILQRHLRISAKCSPHQISPLQISHIPNPPLPRSASRCSSLRPCLLRSLCVFVRVRTPVRTQRHDTDRSCAGDGHDPRFCRRNAASVLIQKCVRGHWGRVQAKGRRKEVDAAKKEQMRQVCLAGPEPPSADFGSDVPLEKPRSAPPPGLWF